MKHFYLILFSSCLLAQNTTDLVVMGTTPSTKGKKVQRLNNGLIQIWDTDASKPMLDIEGGATQGEVWTRKENAVFPTLAPKAAGLSGDTVFGRVMSLGGDPSGFNFRGFEMPAGATGTVLWKLPLSDAAGCVQSDGALNLSISPCGGDDVTRTTAQTGASGITASKTFFGSSVSLNGQTSSGVAMWSLTQNGQAVWTMQDTSGANVMVRIEGGAAQGEIAAYTENIFGTSAKTSALSGNTVFGARLLLGGDLSGFTFRGFEMPSGAFGSVVWKLPTSDANGCWKSDGAGNTSISACGGVTSVTSGGGAIQVSPTTGNVVVACPNCARTDASNTFVVSSAFNAGLSVFATSGTFAVKGFFSEDIMSVTAGSGVEFRSALGTVTAAIGRNGVFSSQGFAGLASATCSSGTFTVRGGLVTSC